MNDQLNGAAQLNQRITKYVDQLATLTDAAKASAAMQAYLESCACFHRYSPHNQLLIFLACPDATHVAGYRDWLRHHRFVRKGEKGIPILAPCRTKPGEDDEEPRLYFRVVYVFDISQTDGEPLPPPPDWKSPEKNRELSERLIALAERHGIRVTVENLIGETQGISRGGAISLSPRAGTKTLIHELAHELLHKDSRTDTRQIVEAEAEAVAYVVARHFGIEGLNSPNYLALWNTDSLFIRSRIERISRCSSQIITDLENTEPSEPEKE